ncbi:hypothetical protein OZ410_00560, partial [Robiginitalea sp. M366]|uniref:hypothetical protein n=1 Tax=Robiginitalea aestuariiviva TaxID=3036903 RepID=UPI00240DFDBD
MKQNFLLTGLLLLLAATLHGQVKIGDNPQTIDPASLLELESTNRVFVINRMTGAQMTAITPSPGALVYNTDEDCLFYFDGAAWINICEALRLNFTAEAIVNSAPTIVITAIGDSLNFEVGEIRSENVVDFSLGSQDIQNNAINADKIAPDAVGTDELQDNAVTDAQIDYTQVTISNLLYDNTASGLLAGNVQAALDELAASAGTVSMVDNGDGSYIFTDASGNTTTISDTSLSTLVDNLDGTYTYTDESGATQVLDTRAASNPYDNTTSGLAATDVQAALDEINGLTNTVSLTDNADGTYTFTDASGNTTTISDTSLSTLVDNLDGTYTYTDESGATQVLDTRAASNPYDNTTSGLAATDVQAAIDEVEARVDVN